MNRGRSPYQEQLDDMRDELLKAKKLRAAVLLLLANSRLILNNRILNTKLQRLTREASKLQKAQKSQYDGKETVNVVKRTLSTPQASTEPRNKSATRERSRRRSKLPTSSHERAGDEISTLCIPATNLSEQRDVDIRGLQEKNKKRLRVAKAYAEQNRKLKERLKQMREQVHAQKNSQPPSQNSIAVSPPRNGLEHWETSQLIELIKKLEEQRLRIPYPSGSNKKQALEENGGSHDRALIKRLYEAELKMAYLRGENDKLKQDVEYFKGKIDLHDRRSSHEINTNHSTFTKSQCRPPEDVSIPPLHISQSFGSLPSEGAPSPPPSSYGSQSNRHNDDEIPTNVLLHVVIELAMAHIDRQLAMKRLNML